MIIVICVIVLLIIAGIILIRLFAGDFSREYYYHVLLIFGIFAIGMCCLFVVTRRDKHTEEFESCQKAVNYYQYLSRQDQDTLLDTGEYLNIQKYNDIVSENRALQHNWLEYGCYPTKYDWKTLPMIELPDLKGE